MATSIFINLPVKDLNRSIAFFTELGFKFNQQFTDETATCMIVNDLAYVMLLTEAKFKTFSPNPISNAHETTEVLNCLSCENRERVDEMVRIAVANGGKALREPMDHGFMYHHAFQDPDGHVWEVMYMDPKAIPPGPQQ
jgi:predicted lactoylglutathione lyase